MELTIEEGNKLIAEFMGVKIHEKWGDYLDATYYIKENINKRSPLTGVHTIEEREAIDEANRKNIWKPKYHSSWDWLMPVVEKIEGGEVDLNVSVVIKNNLCGIYRHKNSTYEILISKYEAGTKIAATYLAIQEFIQWYNSQSK